MTLTGYDFTQDAPLRPLRAIRKKCLECCAGSSQEVARCHITDCTLWPYRHGKRPGSAVDPTGVTFGGITASDPDGSTPEADNSREGTA